MQIANHLVQFGTSERRARIIWLSSGLQSPNHLVQLGTSERRAQIIWFSSGLQSANHLVQFGNSECRAQIIWFSSDFRAQINVSCREFRAQSANYLIKFGTSERKAQIIWFSSGLQSAERESIGSVRDFRAQSACVFMYIYILYMRYQKGQICLLKHVSKYLDKYFSANIFFLYCLLLFLSKHLKIHLALYVFQSKKIIDISHNFIYFC